MLGWLFGKKEPGRKAGSANFLSMPLLRSVTPVDGARVAEAASAMFPSTPVRVSKEDASEAKDSPCFETGNVMVVAGFMPGPVPGREVIESAEMSLMWPDAAAQVGHKAHVVLFATGLNGAVPSAVEVAWGATRVAAGMMKACDACAYYVGGASVVHKPEFVVKVAAAAAGRGAIPVPLWVNPLVTPDGGGRFSASTIGLESLGHREFEIVACKRDPRDLMAMLCGLAEYVLTNGPVLRDGETFGPTAQDRWPVHVGKGKLGKDGDVIRLGVP